MFGKKDDGFLAPAPVVLKGSGAPVFVQFEGATCTLDDDGTLLFTPRGKISIQAANIGGFYDHTILLFGNKIRVMESAAQIELKIMEAMRDA